MILAAAACAEDHGDAPRELRWVFEHDRWGALPNAGGLLDQPAGAVQRMTACENVYRALRFYAEHGPEPGQLAAWRESHTDIWTIVRHVEELRERSAE
jgi:hypothetical protein